MLPTIVRCTFTASQTTVRSRGQINSIARFCLRDLVIEDLSVALTMSLGPERDLDPEVEQEEGFGWLNPLHEPFAWLKGLQVPPRKLPRLKLLPSPGLQVFLYLRLSASHRLTELQNWYTSLPGHDYFCEVHEDFIEDDFNLTGQSR